MPGGGGTPRRRVGPERPARPAGAGGRRDGRRGGGAWRGSGAAVETEAVDAEPAEPAEPAETVELVEVEKVEKETAEETVSPAPAPATYDESVPYDEDTTVLRGNGKRLRRLGWVLAGSCACGVVVLGGMLIGGDSAPPWLSIPGITESRDEDPANPTPAPADSDPGGAETAPGERGVPRSGDAARTGGTPEPSVGARSGGGGSPQPAPTETGAVSPSATSGSPTAPETTPPQSPTGGAGDGGAGSGTPTAPDEPTDPPSDDPDPLGGLLGASSAADRPRGCRPWPRTGVRGGTRAVWPPRRTFSRWPGPAPGGNGPRRPTGSR